ncbi:MAG: sugar transferase [Bacteriovoracaceae bacterium]|nr:sugar transferase [Bacteriovoracaceae bacterium]
MNSAFLIDDFGFKNSSIDSVWADPGLKHVFKNVKPRKKFTVSKYFYETIERSIAFGIILLLLPVFLVIAVASKLTMPGKLFFQQVRVGKNGKKFKIIKFRTMIENAEKETGHTLSWDGDPRITKLGSFLRKSHLDELPQLINVLKGDMSFIGPRPERPEFTSVYEKELLNYERRHFVKPGITGLAQIVCVYDVTTSEKLVYDLLYVSFRNSFKLKMVIAFHTVRKMLLLKDTAGVLKKSLHHA